MAVIITRFALLFVIITIGLLAVTGTLFSPSPAVIFLQVLAVGLAFWARSAFPSGRFRVGAAPAAGDVISNGPYRFIRHPMYAAVLLLIWSAILSHLQAWTLLLGLAVTSIVAARIVLEERVLLRDLPGYAEYARNTKAVIPYVV